MSRLKLLIATALILPLAAWAGGAQSPSPSGATSAVPVVSGGSYDCCWIFIHGRWWCVPC